MNTAMIILLAYYTLLKGPLKVYISNPIFFIDY